MKYQVSSTKTFAGAHFLRGYKGKCENLHGHNWKVRAAFSGSKLDKTGMLLDFTDIKAALDKTMLYLDHKCLNEIPPFNKINPTAENIAAFIYSELKKYQSKTAKIAEVEVWESETSSAIASSSS
ncbi:MAG: 6-carboxytetrahydropterin synthase QueD [Elusimicrobiota bacterium]|jgi:6-pyruvoyltetrahydropterin/6-carboxytetrahydropterin synthase|nr:6-carboxytetrahydropterin synthase QueD [Elusimicrobiota bacterium]